MGKGNRKPGTKSRQKVALRRLYMVNRGERKVLLGLVRTAVRSTSVAKGGEKKKWEKDKLSQKRYELPVDH